MTHESIEGGRIRLEQSKTDNSVDVPVVEPLRQALEAGPLGMVTLLESKDGEPFTPKGFYNLIKRACIQAKIPHCSAHGIRKSAARVVGKLAAPMTRVSQSKLYAMMAGGELRYTKVGRRRLIPASALRAVVGETEEAA